MEWAESPAGVLTAHGRGPCTTETLSVLFFSSHCQFLVYRFAPPTSFPEERFNFKKLQGDVSIIGNRWFKDLHQKISYHLCLPVYGKYFQNRWSFVVPPVCTNLSNRQNSVDEIWLNSVNWSLCLYLRLASDCCWFFKGCFENPNPAR